MVWKVSFQSLQIQKVYYGTVNRQRKKKSLVGYRVFFFLLASLSLPPLQVAGDQGLHLARVCAHVPADLVVVLEGDEGGHGHDLHVPDGMQVPGQVGVQEDHLRVLRDQALVELPHLQALFAVDLEEADEEQLVGPRRGDPASEVAPACDAAPRVEARTGRHGHPATAPDAATPEPGGRTAPFRGDVAAGCGWVGWSAMLGGRF